MIIGEVVNTLEKEPSNHIPALKFASNASRRPAKSKYEDIMIPHGLLVKNLTGDLLTAHEYALVSKVR
jgi:hypothetical protein